MCKVVDIGLSDFHSLTVTMLKSKFKKQEPQIISYRDFKKFSNETFQNLLTTKLPLQNVNHSNYKSFQGIVRNLIDKNVPIKKKHIRKNNSAFIDKAFRKEIMKRSRLFNNFKKNRNKTNWKIYAKQRNFCVSFLRKRKKQFYNNLDVKKITDNEKFSKSLKPCFSDQNVNDEKITLIKGIEII